MKTKAQAQKAVKRIYELQAEIKELKEALRDYLQENCLNDLVAGMDGEKEIAVTYSDGYIRVILNQKEAIRLLEEAKIPVPMTESTVSGRLEIKARKPKENQ